jgi:flagellar basal-body rod protein FlgF
MSQVRETGVYRELGEGPIVETGNTFDLALKGDGYFVVNTPLGPRYTRNGGFTLDPTGRLVTSWGDEVQGEGGAITVSAGETGVAVSTDGTISSRESGPIGKLRVVRFDDEQQLGKVMNGLYATDLPAQNVVPGEVRMVQGAIEGSNVNPVAEIARMIKLQRFFEAMQEIVEQEHRRQRTTINQVFRPHA